MKANIISDYVQTPALLQDCTKEDLIDNFELSREVFMLKGWRWTANAITFLKSEKIHIFKHLKVGYVVKIYSEPNRYSLREFKSMEILKKELNLN